MASRTDLLFVLVCRYILQLYALFLVARADGTGTAVREPYMRSIGAWYYPHETTVIMG